MHRIFASLTPLRRAAVIAGVCALAALYFPAGSFAADEATQTNGDPSASQANPPAKAEMAGCPGVNGSCCANGSCQEKAAESQPADQAAGGCPCQHAKQSHKGS